MIKFHKPTLCFFILLACFDITEAQFICPLDGNMALLYLEKNGEVIIKTKNIDAGHAIYGGLYCFKNEGGVIKSKTEALDSTTNDGQDYEESNYFHYPEFVKIRNNGFLLSNEKGDSVVTDSKGRVTEIYRKTGYRFKFRYLNDTTVLENIIIPNPTDSSSISVYELDPAFHLKTIREGNFKNNFFSVAVSDIDVYSIIKYKYDKNNTRVTNIEMYNVNRKSIVLQSNHTFIYENNKPVKSYVYDVKKKKIVYEQTYTYK